MYTTLAMLLVSTLTSTGLLALWAAGSRRNWFLRVGGFLAALSPLLFVPAFEPLVALVLDGAVVAGGVELGRALNRKRLGRDVTSSVESGMGAPRAWVGPRFSLGTALLGATLVAVGVAVAARAPALNCYAWRNSL